VPDIVKYTLGSGLLALSVTHLAVAPAWIRRVYELRFLTTAGMLSYSVYLWQQPFMALTAHWPWLPCLGLALLTGTASYYGLENPARRWINARWTRARPSGPPATPPRAPSATLERPGPGF
jgi:peptidoglycan/LPS O-acetylase OafA/YrhL